jgi:hypothetical protein
MLVEIEGRLESLRRERERTRARLIDLEIEIALLVSAPSGDIVDRIAEAEERGAWPEAARLRAAHIFGTAEK